MKTKTLFLLLLLIQFNPQIVQAGWVDRECYIIKAGIDWDNPLVQNSKDTHFYFDESTGFITIEASGVYHTVTQYNVVFYVYYMENGGSSWILNQAKTGKLSGAYTLDFDYIEGDLPEGCPTRCDGLENQLITDCYGEENVNWDNCSCKPSICPEPTKSELADQCGGYSKIQNWYVETPWSCGGDCKPACTGFGDETEAQALERCAQMGFGLAAYFGEPQCIGVCDTCTEEKMAAEIERCKPYGVQYFSEETCTATCDSCADKRPEAEAECYAQDRILISYTCDADGDVLPVCGDPEGPILPDPDTDPGEDPQDPPQDPPPDEDPEEPDPNNPDPDNAELEAINNNLGKLINQNNDRKDQLNEINKDTDWIGKNNKIIADNTYAIAKALNNAEFGLDDGDSANLDRMAKYGKDQLEELKKINNNLDTEAGNFDSIPDPELDPIIAEEDRPEEEDLQALIQDQYATFPDLDIINQSKVTFANSKSCLTITNPLTNQSVQAICFSDYAALFQKMGWLLLAISAYTGLTIASGVRG